MTRDIAKLDRAKEYKEALVAVMQTTLNRMDRFTLHPTEQEVYAQLKDGWLSKIRKHKTKFARTKPFASRDEDYRDPETGEREFKKKDTHRPGSSRTSREESLRLAQRMARQVRLNVPRTGGGAK